MTVLVAGKQPAVSLFTLNRQKTVGSLLTRMVDKSLTRPFRRRSKKVDRRGQVVTDRHDAQLAAFAVNQKRGAGRPVGADLVGETVVPNMLG